MAIRFSSVVLGLAMLVAPVFVYSQVTMVQPFVPSYNYAIAYTTGCSADLCIPTVYAGLDENGDPIYVHHDVEIDLSEVGAGSLVIGVAGGIASVSGPIQDSINNLLRGHAVDLTSMYSWENGANASGGADVALEGGDCLIKPELVLPEVLFSDCIEAGAALHGNFVGYQNSSPNCVAPSGFLEFFYDNSLYAGPQAEFQWTNLSSPLEACDEAELDAAIEAVGPIAEIEAADVAPELLAAMEGLLPPFNGEDTEEEELRRRLAELYGTTFDLPAYSQVGSLFTDDYETDGEVPGQTPTPEPPLGGYEPQEPGGNDGNDIVEFCAANPTRAICQNIDSALIDTALSEQEAMLDGALALVGDADGFLDGVFEFEFGSGPVLGPSVDTCPLDGGLLVSTSPEIFLDTEPYCEISGGPIRLLIGMLATINAAIVLFRGLQGM